ncbi:MAG TPA: hypothetical protein VH482_21345 [Thermomicrobiales bacterium]
MTVTMIVALPGVTDAPDVTAQRMLRAALQLGDLVYGVRPAEPVAASLVAARADGEPTWEDAAWQ